MVFMGKHERFAAVAAAIAPVKGIYFLIFLTEKVTNAAVEMRIYPEASGFHYHSYTRFHNFFPWTLHGNQNNLKKPTCPPQKPQAKQNKPKKPQPKQNQTHNKKPEDTILVPREQFLSYGLPGGKCMSGTFNFTFKLGFIVTFLTIDSDFFKLASKDRSK